jgi:hypothetical protein
MTDMPRITLLPVGNPDRRALDDLAHDLSEGFLAPMERNETHDICFPPVGFARTDASHLFLEPGALEAVIDYAAQWSQRYLAPRSAAPTPAVETWRRGA